jgi:hypothetical protein
VNGGVPFFLSGVEATREHQSIKFHQQPENWSTILKMGKTRVTIIGII